MRALLLMRARLMRLREMQRKGKKKRMMQMMVLVSVDTDKAKQTKAPGEGVSHFLTVRRSASSSPSEDETQLTCIRERMTWYGYVMAIATSLAEPDIRMYSVLLCRSRRRPNNMRQGRKVMVSIPKCLDLHPSRGGTAHAPTA